MARLIMTKVTMGLRLTAMGAFFAVASLICLGRCLLRPFHPDNSRWCGTLYAYGGRRLLGLKVSVQGEENFPTDEPFVVVANHQSNHDVTVLAGVVPPRTVSVGKASLKWVPVFGQLYWLAGSVLVQRGNSKQTLRAMDTVTDALRNRRVNIWFFPEGTRNHGANLLPFKKGAFLSAIAAGVPVVRVCASSYLEVLGDAASARHAIVNVLPPLPTAQLTAAEVGTLIDECHTTMCEEIRRLDAAIAARAY